MRGNSSTPGDTGAAGQGMREQDVRRFARSIRARMRERNGGRLPRTLSGWEQLCRNFGVDPVPLVLSPSRFRARLIVTELGAFAFYNRHAPARQVRHYLAHELGEKIAMDDLPGLFDAVPGTAHYTGGADPRDIRHRVACQLERLCFRR